MRSAFCVGHTDLRWRNLEGPGELVCPAADLASADLCVEMLCGHYSSPVV